LYSCPGCGSMMVFDPARQQLKCGMCDRTESIESADQREARQASDRVEMDLFTCPNCGGKVHAMNTTAASFCSYCGSPVMLNHTRSEVSPPDTIAPFRVTRDECFAKYQQMLKKSLCVDHRLKKDVNAESFRGIYVPFHTYSAGITGSAVLEGHQTKGNDTYYYSTAVNLNHHFDDILHDASKEMPDALSERISRVPTDSFKSFSPAYMSGFYADTPDTSPNAYLSFAKAAAVREGLRDVMDSLDDGCSYSTAEAEKKLIPLATAKHTGETLVPYWFMSLRSGKRVLYAVQNGITGEMAADTPLDIPRFALFALILAIPLFFLLNSFLTLRPEMVMVVAMLLAVAAQLIVNGRRKAVKEQQLKAEMAESAEDDMSSRMAQRKRMENRAASGTWYNVGGIGGAILLIAAMYGISLIDTIQIFWLAALVLTVVMIIILLIGRKNMSKPPLGSFVALLAMIAGTCILITDVFHSDDTALYLVSFVILASVVWESIDLLLMHNKECSNPLPQFETHQGGEDHA